MNNVLLKEKLEKRQYISKYLYESVKREYPRFISSNSDLDGYNNQILEREYQKYKDYFDKMYANIDNNIHLDKDQVKAILADEEYLLILAGAGTGKTTTMASKVKYLVDVKHVDPKRIMVMSYSRKTVEELEQRINIDFRIDAQVKTFHSLGMMYIREHFKDHKCGIVDVNKQRDIFVQYFKERIFPYKNRIKEVYDNFSSYQVPFSKHFIAHYEEYNTFDEYFERYKKDKIQEAGKRLEEVVERKINTMVNADIPKTIKGELVKSKGEALIANFLFCHGINYRYEKIYYELMEERKTYMPDFTLDLDGKEVYIEYFGLSNYRNDQMNRYEVNRRKKEKYHKEHHTSFIGLDIEYGENILDKLDAELKRLGFHYHEKTSEEIYLQILDNNPVSQMFQYQNLLYDVISTIKSSLNREYYKEMIRQYVEKFSGNERKEYEIQCKYIIDFYKYYEDHLRGAETYYFDFSDMLYYANKYIYSIGNDNHLQFDYLIIDEYQDISQERYDLTRRIALKNNAKVVAVGDDWQAIYGYAGSKIEYIYNFQKYFKGSKVLKINQTYRNSQELVNYSGEFIMKNRNQIPKQLKSNKSLYRPIEFVCFDENEEYSTLKELIVKIHEKNRDHHILILARNNSMINHCFKDPAFHDDIGTKISFMGYDDLEMDGMTIHKSKGLTSDEVIIIGLNDRFPSGQHTNFWMKNIFVNKNETEPIKYAEERRLFYVALTRTKNKVYLLVNRNPEKRSEFLEELARIVYRDGNR